MPAIYDGKRMVRKSELIPCPFCAERDLCMYTNDEPEDSKDRRHYVHCFNCGTNGPVCESFLHAINRWQTREILYPVDNIENLLAEFYKETGNRGLWNTNLYTGIFLEWILRRTSCAKESTTQDNAEVFHTSPNSGR